ncbi:MAG: hypothetical protein WCK89_13815 [bacterium]
MSTGFDELDSLAEDGKSAVSDIRLKWKMKLAGAAVIGIGALITRYWSSPPVMFKIGTGIIVVGVLMVLGTDGIKFVLKQLYSAGRKR